MAEGRNRSEWDRTALTVAMIVNSNPYREGAAVQPDVFHPYAARARREEKPLKADLSILKTMFFAQKGKKRPAPLISPDPKPCPAAAFS